MPQLNSRGDLLNGFGGIISVNNQPTVLHDANAYCWISDDEIGYQLNLEKSTVRKYNIKTGEDTLIMKRGASFNYGGAGHIITEITPGALFLDGVLLANDGGQASIAQDGSYAYVTHYSTGKGIALNNIDLSGIPDEFIMSLQCLDKDTLFWANGTNKARILFNNLITTIKCNTSIAIAKLIRTANKYYIMYNWNARLVIHDVNDTSRGWVIGNGDGTTFNFDAVVLPNGMIRVCWATTQGDVPGFSYDIDEANTSMVSFVDMPIAKYPQAFNRKMWYAPYFSLTENYGDTSDYIGNCALIFTIGAMQHAAARNLPIICSAEGYDKSYESLIIAYYSESKNPVADLARINQLPEKPVIINLDGNNYPVAIPTYLNSNKHWLGVEFYRNIGETLATYQARMEAFLTFMRVQYANFNLVAIPQFYQKVENLNVTDVNDIIEIAPLTIKWIQDNQNFIGIMPFADMRQGPAYPGGPIVGGINLYPALKDLAKQLYALIPDKPNRFDYWNPSSTTIQVRLRNKLGQTVQMINLSAFEKDYLISLLK